MLKYIFVLDASGSVKDPLPDGLRDSYIREYKGVTARSPFNVARKSNPCFQNFAALRIYRLLLDILDRQESKKATDKFAIWTVGTDAEPVYPPASLADVDTPNLTYAVAATEALMDSSGSKYTDFVRLFGELNRKYKGLREPRTRRYSSPDFIITILSDLLEDIWDRKKLGKEKTRQHWEDLNNKIEAVCNAHSMINLVVLSEEGEFRLHETIAPLIGTHTDWYRLEGEMIGDNRAADYLFPVMSRCPGIWLYYQDPYDIDEIKFTISQASSSTSRFSIDLPEEIGTYPVNWEKGMKFRYYADDGSADTIYVDIPHRLMANLRNRDDRLRLQYKAVTKDTSIIEDEATYGTLVTGRDSPPTIRLARDQMLVLSYSDIAPSRFVKPVLRIRFMEQNETLLIPIRFVKLIPWWACGMMITAQAAGVIVPLLLLLLVPLFYGYERLVRPRHQVIRRRSRAAYTWCGDRLRSLSSWGHRLIARPSGDQSN